MSSICFPRSHVTKKQSASKARRARAVAQALERRVLLSTVNLIQNSLNTDHLDVFAAADFNSDGRQDVAAVNSASHILYVFRGNGNGTFNAPSSAPLGTLTPTALVSSDINLDNHPDLILVDSSANRVAILPGDGTGRFGAPITYATGSSPVALAVADLNNDNRPDLVIANSSSNSLSILLQSAGGSFYSGPAISTTFSPRALTTANFNGDSNTDIAVVGSDPNVLILSGAGDATFSSSLALVPGTTSHSSVVAADFNQDGFIDLAVSQAGSSHQLAELFNNQSGAWTIPQFFENPGFGGTLISGHFLSRTSNDLITTLASGALGLGRVYTSSSIGLVSADAPNFAAASTPSTTGDFNGDGLTDFTGFYSSTGSNKFYQLFFNHVQPLSLGFVGVFGNNQPTNVTVATITDPLQPDPTSLQAVVSWGDNRYSAGTVISDGNGAYHVVASHSYLFTGTFGFNVTITDSFQNTASIGGGINLKNGAPSSTLSETETPIFQALGASQLLPDTQGGFWSRADNGPDTVAIHLNPNGTGTTYYLSPQGRTAGISVDLAGNLWAITYLGGIVRITLSGSRTDYSIPYTLGSPIVSGPNNQVWFLLLDNDFHGFAFGRLSTDGTFNMTPLQRPLSDFAYDMVLGPDGNFWITESEHYIARVTPAGDVTEFPTPTLADGNRSQNQRIIVGSDGIMWFANYDIFTNHSVLYRLATDGSLNLVAMPPIAINALSPAPGGSIWIAWNNSIGRVTPQGQVTIYPTNSGTLFPASLPPGAAGIVANSPDGKIWFTEQFLGKLGTIDPSHLLVMNPISNFQLDSNNAFNGNLLTFTDPNGPRPLSSYDASVDWGDGTRSIATITPGPGNAFTVSAAHIFIALGQHAVGVSIHPQGDITQTQYFNEYIPPAPLSLVSSLPSIVTQRGALTPVQPPLATFFDPDPTAAAGQFTVTVSWGDFVDSTATVTAGPIPGQFIVTAQHTYQATGNVTATIRVVDSGIATLTTSIPVTVLPAAILSISEVVAPSSGFLVTADVNNDHFPDIITISQFKLGVLLGNGDGTFKSETDTPAANAIGDIVTSDFNHDGNIDIAYPVSAPTPITAILLGNGDGTFAPASTIPTSGSLAVADFTGDNLPDIIAPSLASLRLAAGNGDGTFDVSNLPITGQLDQLVTADFNGDHLSDLALVTRSAGTPQLLVYLASGNGTFQPPAVIPLPFTSATAPLNLTAGDIDSDGRTDLLIANSAGNQMLVLHGNADGTFADATPSSLQQSTVATSTVGSIALADLNSDGHPDLITIGKSDSNLRIRLGLGDGTFSPEILVWNINRPLSNLSLSDFNGDGSPDFVVGSDSSGLIALFFNSNYRGGYTFPDQLVAGTPFTASNLYTFVPSYHPIDLSTLSATIQWGDGTTSQGYILPSTSGDGSFTVGGTHVYKHPGQYIQNVSIIHNQFAISTASGYITVSQPDVTFYGGAVRRFIVNQPYTDAIEKFHDPNPYSRASDFSAVIHWTDGTTTQPVIVPDPLGSTGDYLVVDSRSSTPSANINFLNLTYADGVTRRDFAFIGVFPPVNGGATISGTVFNDLNRNGTQQSGEPSLAYWRVFDDVNFDGIWENSEPSDLVSPGGTYHLADVPAGYQNIHVVIPPGWRTTAPTPSNGDIIYPVNSGDVITGINFSLTPKPPTIINSRFNYDSFPQSVTFTFSEPVSGATAPNATAAYNLDTGATVPIVSSTYDADLNTLTIYFSGILPDGNYAAQVGGGAITDSLGQHLGANPDGTGASDYSTTFYTLTGDINRDGVVDSGDFAILSANYHKSALYSQGDITGEGYVDFSDFSRLSANMGQSSHPLAIRPGDLIVSSMFDNLVYDIAPDGTRTLLAHAGQPEGLAADPFGNVYIAEVDGNPVDQVLKVSNTGALSAFVNFPSNVSSPEGLAFAQDGTLYVTGGLGAKDGFPPPMIDTITPDGQIHPYVIAGKIENIAVTLDSHGNLYTVDIVGDDGSLYKVTPDGTVTEITQDLMYATGVAVAPDGTVLVSDSIQNKIWAVAPDGTKSVYLNITRPFALLFDPLGNLYVGQDQLDAQGHSSLIRISPDGTQTTIATNLNGIRGLALVKLPSLPVPASPSTIPATTTPPSTAKTSNTSGSPVSPPTADPATPPAGVSTHKASTPPPPAAPPITPTSGSNGKSHSPGQHSAATATPPPPDTSTHKNVTPLPAHPDTVTHNGPVLPPNPIVGNPPTAHTEEPRPNQQITHANPALLTAAAVSSTPLMIPTPGQPKDHPKSAPRHNSKP